ncbi:hypothetical protein [uncultured Cohaesibacter sp.]|uniref:hypothetical protein n=1 Tax=uncultured Cohaesibacter sp. TaxID=1002546 RepID=UPI002AA62EF1|nr:hypothetical protein [uncultured Cohaesibacter sp.]
MAELLNREYQKSILNSLADHYPRLVSPRDFFDENDPRTLVNLFYLQEHDLVELNANELIDGSITIGSARINAQGLDFLADDGGLGAILGTITVRFQDEQIRSLLLESVSKSEAPNDVKDQLVSTIQSLPSDILKNVANKAAMYGICHAPVAIETLRSWMQS